MKDSNGKVINVGDVLYGTPIENGKAVFRRLNVISRENMDKERYLVYDCNGFQNLPNSSGSGMLWVDNENFFKDYEVTCNATRF
jgi:hypothetical protein